MPKRRRKLDMLITSGQSNFRLWLLVFCILGILFYFVLSYQPKSEVVPPLETLPKDKPPATTPDMKPTIIVPEKEEAAEKEKSAKKIMAKIAVVIDDLGQDLEISRHFMALDSAVTVSILPDLPYSQKIAEEAKKRGHDIILHLPMEPEGYPNFNPGKGTLLSSMNRDQIIKVLKENISSVPYIKGISNHMGSKLTADRASMEIIFEELKGGNLFFLDSRTNPNSQAYNIAKKNGLKATQRDIFLDNERQHEGITRMIAKLESIAMKNGKAVGIGHPYNETLMALKESLPRLRANSFKVVPLSEIVE